MKPKAKPAPKLKPVPEIVEALRDELARAEAGTIRSFAMACVTSEGEVDTTAVLGDCTTCDLYAATSAMANGILEEICVMGVPKRETAPATEAPIDLAADVPKGPFN